MTEALKSPVTVKITNNTGEAKTLQWLGRGQQWIAAKGSIVIDYEPFSCAERWQRENLLAALRAGNISLEISLLTDSGVVTVPYNPAAMSGSPVAPQVGMQRDARAQEVGNGHYVMAGGGANTARRMGFGASAPAPDYTQSMKAQENVGFVKSRPGMPQGAVANFPTATTEEVKETLSKQAADPEPAPVADEPRASGDAALDVDSLAAEFDALAEEHRWADALRLLIDHYGKEKINFGTRALMSLKTFKAVAEKYNL